jgi:hypothetical protein
MKLVKTIEYVVNWLACNRFLLAAGFWVSGFFFAICESQEVGK